MGETWSIRQVLNIFIAERFFKEEEGKNNIITKFKTAYLNAVKLFALITYFKRCVPDNNTRSALLHKYVTYLTVTGRCEAQVGDEELTQTLHKIMDNNAIGKNYKTNNEYIINLSRIAKTYNGVRNVVELTTPALLNVKTKEDLVRLVPDENARMYFFAGMVVKEHEYRDKLLKRKKKRRERQQQQHNTTTTQHVNKKARVK